MIEARGQPFGTRLAGARRRRVPLLDDRLERVAFARQRDDRLMIRRFERVEPQQDVGVLTEREAKIAPLERDVTEPDERAAGLFLFLEPAVVRRNPGKRHARLETSLDVDERDLQVDG